MSDKDSKQTLIPRDDDEQWQKVLKGDLDTDFDSETHREARELREYLLSKELEIIEQSTPPSHTLTTISAEEARVEFRRASREIHRRANAGWQRWIRYGLVSIFGIMAGLVTFFAAHYYSGQSEALNTTSGTWVGTQDFGDKYKVFFGEEPGDLPNMLPIPAGQFIMGCNSGWDDVAGGCRNNEYPPHTVAVKAFELAQHEVTVLQFKRFVKETDYKTSAERKGCAIADTDSPSPHWIMEKSANWRAPGFEQEDSHPVVCISRDDAMAYISWLNKTTNKQYRLPTEAEWEYAARAGTATPYSWGNQADSNKANFKGTNEADIWPYTAPVGRFPANSFTLQDMLGNAWEWVSDCWHENYVSAPTDGTSWNQDCHGTNFITRRGGAWDASSLNVRSSYRSSAGGKDRSQSYGFRIAHDIDAAD